MKKLPRDPFGSLYRSNVEVSNYINKFINAWGTKTITTTEGEVVEVMNGPLVVKHRWARAATFARRTFEGNEVTSTKTFNSFFDEDAVVKFNGVEMPSKYKARLKEICVSTDEITEVVYATNETGGHVLDENGNKIPLLDSYGNVTTKWVSGGAFWTVTGGYPTATQNSDVSYYQGEIIAKAGKVFTDWCKSDPTVPKYLGRGYKVLHFLGGSKFAAQPVVDMEKQDIKGINYIFLYLNPEKEIVRKDKDGKDIPADFTLQQIEGAVEKFLNATEFVSKKEKYHIATGVVADGKYQVYSFKRKKKTVDATTGKSKNIYYWDVVFSSSIETTVSPYDRKWVNAADDNVGLAGNYSTPKVMFEDFHARLPELMTKYRIDGNPLGLIALQELPKEKFTNVVAKPSYKQYQSSDLEGYTSTSATTTVTFTYTTRFNSIDEAISLFADKLEEYRTVDTSKVSATAIGSIAVTIGTMYQANVKRVQEATFLVGTKIVMGESTGEYQTSEQVIPLFYKPGHLPGDYWVYTDETGWPWDRGWTGTGGIGVSGFLSPKPYLRASVLKGDKLSLKDKLLVVTQCIDSYYDERDYDSNFFLQAILVVVTVVVAIYCVPCATYLASLNIVVAIATVVVAFSAFLTVVAVLATQLGMNGLARAASEMNTTIAPIVRVASIVLIVAGVSNLVNQFQGTMNKVAAEQLAASINSGAASSGGWAEITTQELTKTQIETYMAANYGDIAVEAVGRMATDMVGNVFTNLTDFGGGWSDRLQYVSKAVDILQKLSQMEIDGRLKKISDIRGKTAEIQQALTAAYERRNVNALEEATNSFGVLLGKLQSEYGYDAQFERELSGLSIGNICKTSVAALMDHGAETYFSTCTFRY